MAKSMSMNLASGLQGMLKDGHTSYDGVDEAILRNINAAKELAAIVRTSLGPNGESNKLSSAAFSFRNNIVYRLYDSQCEELCCSRTFLVCDKSL